MDTLQSFSRKTKGDLPIGARRFNRDEQPVRDTGETNLNDDDPDVWPPPTPLEHCPLR